MLWSSGFGWVVDAMGRAGGGSAAKDVPCELGRRGPPAELSGVKMVIAFASTRYGAAGGGRRATALAAAALLLSACAGDTDNGDDSPGPDGPPTIEGTQVSAELTEFAITLDTTTFSAGTYTFVAKEQGQAPHALSIEGPGVDTTSTDVLNPGDADAALTVDLSPGTYTLWCPVGDHRSQGMELTITVT